MTLGPLEYLVVGFEGNRFTGQILSELRAARDKGIIRIIDLLLIMKDENGDITAMEMSDLSSEEAEQFGSIAGDLLQAFEPDDVEAAANQTHLQKLSASPEPSPPAQSPLSAIPGNSTACSSHA